MLARLQWLREVGVQASVGRRERMRTTVVSTRIPQVGFLEAPHYRQLHPPRDLLHGRHDLPALTTPRLVQHPTPAQHRLVVQGLYHSRSRAVTGTPMSHWTCWRQEMLPQ